ncbi:hypothetical protein E3T43_16780 [Cryobacterium sp. Hh7]|uniref:hypothetical protein n=1 Tax=Cryobacterium sp. Hh7 TaxID=1259159 RepID=UPI00106A4EE8|nr:hypothetical protein [Cryobacterium sp. Hh7]TFD51056.1 hypothetical protein E3T43_16780 [Cryobacterium sp. Hh7]
MAISIALSEGFSMFHTFLHPISDFSGGASAAVGIDLPPIAVIALTAVDVDQQSAPRTLEPPRPSPFRTDNTTRALGDWLDNLPARGWDF